MVLSLNVDWQPGFHASQVWKSDDIRGLEAFWCCEVVGKREACMNIQLYPRLVMSPILEGSIGRATTAKATFLFN